MGGREGPHNQQCKNKCLIFLMCYWGHRYNFQDLSMKTVTTDTLLITMRLNPNHFEVVLFDVVDVVVFVNIVVVIITFVVVHFGFR